MVFVLFTYYMVTDPATTPSSWAPQVIFGMGVAAVYGALVVLHIVFGFFFALTIVCATRGLLIYGMRLRGIALRRRAVEKIASPAFTNLPGA